MTNPLTPEYGLPYENDESQPLSSISGGSSGTELILAEEVEDELERIDGDVASLQTSVNELDSRGWHDITGAGGTTITGPTTIPIPSGQFDIIHVTARGSLSDLGLFGLQVNEDTSSSLYHRSRRVYSFDTGDIAVVGGIPQHFATTGNNWWIGYWGTNVHNWAEAYIYATDGDNLLSYSGRSFRATSSASARYEGFFGGSLDSTRLLSSITTVASGGATHGTIRLWVEGHRA